MGNQSTDPAGLDKLNAEQMAAWLRETAVNTRRHSNPAWCDAHCKPFDPLAAHVAFRMEQAATLLVEAERYRWLRDHIALTICARIDQTITHGTPEKLDELIDERRAT